MWKNCAIVLIILAIAGPCLGEQVYTNRTDFDQAIAWFASATTVDLDSLPDGSPASTFGPMTISARGLDSDGHTWLTLPPAVTDDFPATSGRKCLGVSFSGHQFLSGNGDKITFAFSAPINAFGLQMIGNPSPTGSPAIPFWRMTTESPTFTANSATVPQSTLGTGSDVYFLGIVSIDQPFSEVNLYSDNDLAAVFSFNCDDIIHASLPPLATIQQARSITDGEVTIPSALVTRVHADRFNVASLDPFAGMAVLGTGAEHGYYADFWGSVSVTPDDERVLVLGGLGSHNAIPGRIGPFHMGTASLGGFPMSGLQVGVSGSMGPNNIGLDAVLCGRVSAVNTAQNWIIVDDGARRSSGELDTLETPIPGVKCIGAVGASGRTVGDMLAVRGSISLWKSGSDHYPLLRVAQPDDITPYYP